MTLWEYIRTEVDNEITEGKICEAEAFRRICKEKWKMTEDIFVAFVLYRRMRMVRTRTDIRKYICTPHVPPKKQKQMVFFETLRI